MVAFGGALGVSLPVDGAIIADEHLRRCAVCSRRACEHRLVSDEIHIRVVRRRRDARRRQRRTLLVNGELEQHLKMASLALSRFYRQISVIAVENSYDQRQTQPEGAGAMISTASRQSTIGDQV